MAKLAYDIYNETVDFDPRIHLVAGDEQCTFCPVRGRCPARAARIAKMFEPLINRHELDDKSVGTSRVGAPRPVLPWNDFEEEALRRAKMGTEIEGHKLGYAQPGQAPVGRKP